MATIKITLTSVKNGGYILTQEVAPLWKEAHRQAFGWSEHDALLAVVRQMLADTDRESQPNG